MFKKKDLDNDKDLIKLAKRYKKILDNAKVLPKNSLEMFRVIKKAGI